MRFIRLAARIDEEVFDIISAHEKAGRRCKRLRRDPRSRALSVPSLARFKTCTKCECTKPATAEFFHKNCKAKDGFLAPCKVCGRLAASDYRRENKEAIREKDRKYREEHPGKRAESDRAWRENNRQAKAEYDRWYQQNNREALAEHYRRYRQENKEKIAEYGRRYREKNKEVLAVRKRRYELENREAQRESARLWRSKNRDKVNAADRRRRARIRGGRCEVYDGSDVQEIWESQQGCCLYCGTPLFGSYEIEHMTPLSRGGSDTLDNLCLSCQPCNRWKYTKTADEFLETLRHDRRRT